MKSSDFGEAPEFGDDFTSRSTLNFDKCDGTNLQRIDFVADSHGEPNYHSRGDESFQSAIDSRACNAQLPGERGNRGPSIFPERG
ncbi:hypothetical protein GCM10027402_06690 [Arthrobacter monumenti]